MNVGSALAGCLVCCTRRTAESAATPTTPPTEVEGPLLRVHEEFPLRPRLASDHSLASKAALQFWCLHPPTGGLTDAQRAKCEALREQVSRIFNLSHASLDECLEKFERLNGTTTPRGSQVALLALRTGHPEIAASMLLGILDSGLDPEETQTVLVRMDVLAAGVVAGLRGLDQSQQPWATPMADELHALEQRHLDSLHVDALEHQGEYKGESKGESRGESEVRIVLPQLETLDASPRRSASP